MLASAVAHSGLIKTALTTAPALLRDYAQYVPEVKRRAQQIARDIFPSMGAANPIKMRFCENSESLVSLINLAFILIVPTYLDLTDEIPRTYRFEKEAESKNVVTISMLDKVVKDNSAYVSVQKEYMFKH